MTKRRQTLLVCRTDSGPTDKRIQRWASLLFRKNRCDFFLPTNAQKHPNFFYSAWKLWPQEISAIVFLSLRKLSRHNNKKRLTSLKNNRSCWYIKAAQALVLLWKSDFLDLSRFFSWYQLNISDFLTAVKSIVKRRRLVCLIPPDWRVSGRGQIQASSLLFGRLHIILPHSEEFILTVRHNQMSVI